MPFNLFRRHGKEEATASVAPAAAPGRRVRFDGLSEEWRLVGYMEITGRLSDALNRREPVELTDMKWASMTDGGELEDAPGLRTIDPYDLIVVLAGEESLPPLTEEEKAAFRVHKVPYDVALELPPYHVVGRVYLFPGTDPSKLMDRATDMFMPVTDAVATLGGRRVNDPRIDTILVNRFYLRGVEQMEEGGERQEASAESGAEGAEGAPDVLEARAEVTGAAADAAAPAEPPAQASAAPTGAEATSDTPAEAAEAPKEAPVAGGDAG